MIMNDPYHEVEQEVCWKCNGDKFILDYFFQRRCCPECHGTGFVDKPDSINDIIENEQNGN